MSSGPFFQRLILAIVGAASLMACTQDIGSTKHRAPATPGADYWEGEQVTEVNQLEPSKVNDNSGAFGAPARPNTTPSDGGSTQTTSGEKVYCDGDLAKGDLGVTEIMIASAAGANDSGEWVEIASTRDCWLKLDGVSVESPRGALAPNVAALPNGFELAPHGTFVVADSSDPTKNHALPGKVVTWNASDALKNDGDTISVKLGGAVVDTITYPALDNLAPGRSLSFPSNCAWTARATWGRWSLTFDEFSPGYQGTPNAENSDVSCF